MLKSTERASSISLRGDDDSEASQGSTLEEDGEAFDSAAEELESDHWDTGSARSGPAVRNQHHRRLSSSLLGYDYDEVVQQSRMHQCVGGSPLKDKEGPLFKANRIDDEGLSWLSSMSPYGSRQGTQLHSDYGNGVASFAEMDGQLSNGKMDTAVVCASPIKDLLRRHPSWQQKSRELTRGADIPSPKHGSGSQAPRVEADVSQNEGSLQALPNEGSPRTSHDALEREVQLLRAENEELEKALRAANSNSAQLGELQQYVQFVEERYEELLELYRTSEERVHELKEALEEEEAIREAMEEDIAIAKQGMNHEEQVRELQVKLLRSERHRRELEILLKEAEESTPSTIAEEQVVDMAHDCMMEEYQQKIKELEDEATTLTYENVDQARRVAQLVQELTEKDSVISELMATVGASNPPAAAWHLPENGVRETGTDGMEDWQSERVALEAQIAQLAEEKEQSIATVRSETAAEIERLTLEMEERMADVREAQIQAEMTISGLRHQIESMQTDLTEERYLKKNAEMRIRDDECPAKKDWSATCQFGVEASLGVASTNLPSGDVVGDSSSMVSDGGLIDGRDGMAELAPEVNDPNLNVRHLSVLNVKLMEEARSRESSGVDSARGDNEQGMDEREEQEDSADKPSVGPGNVTYAPLLKPPIIVNVQCVEADKESADKPSAGLGGNVTCAPLLDAPTVVSVQFVETEALGQVANAGSREEDQCPKECCVSDIMTTQATVEANLKNLEILPGFLAKEETEANMDAEREVLFANQAMSDSLEKLSVEVPRLEDIIARLESEVQDTDTSDGDLSVEVQRLVDIIGRLEWEVQKRESSVDDLTIALRRQEVGGRQAEEENDTLRVTLEELGERLQEEVEKRSAADEELDRNRERMEKELEKAKSCTLFANASLEKLSDNVANLEETINVKERMIAELEAQKAKLESELHSMQLSTATLEAKVVDLQKDLEVKRLQQEVEQWSDADEVINPSPQKSQKAARVLETPMEVLNASIKKLSDDVTGLTETLHLKEKMICQLEEDKMRLEDDLCALQLHSTHKHDMDKDAESSSDLTEDMAQTSASNEFLSGHMTDTDVLHGRQMETTDEERLEPCAVKVEAESLGSAPVLKTKPGDVHNAVTAESDDNSVGSEFIADGDPLYLSERTMELNSCCTLEENLASTVQPARDDALARSKELAFNLQMVQAEKKEVLQHLWKLQEQLISLQGGESFQRTVEPQIEKLEDQLRTSETEKNHARICVKELETKLQASEAEKQEALHRTADADLEVLRDQLTSVSAARDSAVKRVKELESELVEVKAEKQEFLRRTAESQVRMAEVELSLAQTQRTERKETMIMPVEELETKPLADKPEKEGKPVQTAVESSPPVVGNDALTINHDLPAVELIAMEEEKQRNEESPGESEEKCALTKAEGDCAQNVHVNQEMEVKLLTYEAGNHKKSIEEAELSGKAGLTAESTFVEVGADDTLTRTSELQSKPFITEPTEKKDSLHRNAETKVCGFAAGNNSTVVCNSGHESEKQGALQRIVQAKIKALVEGLALATAAIDGSMMHSTVFELESEASGGELVKGKELKAVMKIVKELDAIVQMVVSKDDSCLFCNWGDESDVPIVDFGNEEVVPRIVKVELKVLGEDFSVGRSVAGTDVLHSTESKLKSIELEAEESQRDIEGMRNLGKAEGVDDGLEGSCRATSQRSNLLMLSARDGLDLPQVAEKCPQTLDEQLAMAVFARGAALDHQRDLELKLAAVEAEKEEAMQKVAEAENLAKELMEDALRRSKELKSKLFVVEGEKKAAMQEVENVQGQLFELEKRIKYQISENDTLQRRLSASEVEKEVLKERIATAEEDSRQTSEEVLRLMNDLATVKHDADEGNRFNQAEIVRLDAMLESTRRELAVLDATKEELETHNIELSSLKINLSAKMTAAEMEMAEYKQRISNLELELSRLREASEQERLADSAQEAKLSALQVEKTVLEERVQQAEEARAKIEGELALKIEKLQSEVQSLTEKLSMSNSQKQALESQAFDLRTVNEELKEQLKCVEEEALASDSTIRELEKTTAYLEDELKMERAARDEIESRNRELEAELRDVNGREVSTALVLSNLRMEKENLADMMRELESKNKSLICTKEMLETQRDELTEKLLRTEQCLDESRREAALLASKMRKAESAADDVQEVQTAMLRKMEKQIRALEEECDSLLADKDRLEQKLLQKQDELWHQSTAQQNELERLRKENQELSEANAALQRAGSGTRSPSREKTELRQMVMVLQSELRMKVTILNHLVQKRNDDSTSRSLENSGITSSTSDSGEGALIDKSIKFLESHLRHAEDRKEDVPVEHEIERLQVLNKNLTVNNSGRTDDNNMRKELLRLMAQNEDLAQKERELTSKMVAQGSLEKEIERLKEIWKQSVAETEELRQEQIHLKLQLAEVTTERDQLVQDMKQLKRIK